MLSLAKKYKKWYEKYWENILFLDETHFIIQGQRSRYVKKSHSEKPSPKHIDQSVKYPKKMFWGCFSINGPGPLVPVDGMMNSYKAIEVVRRQVICTLTDKWSEGNSIFQQDHSPCHKSRKVTQFFQGPQSD